MTKTLSLPSSMVNVIDNIQKLSSSIEADKIVKTDTDIVGYDSAGNELFAFRGISDFSKFTLADGEEFDTEDDPIADLQQQNANLLLQIALQEQAITEMGNQNAAIMLQLAGGTN
ncbi:MAG: hypothetical protein ACE3JK_01605 [Sporolactobacillus sp.]